jgi:hypothetical protein
MSFGGGIAPGVFCQEVFSYILRCSIRARVVYWGIDTHPSIYSGVEMID